MADFLQPFSHMAKLAARPLTSALLNEHGVQAILLQDFRRIFLSTDSGCRAIRQLVLKMVVCLSRQKVSSTDVQLMLDLFKEDQAPLADLLPALADVMRSAGVHPPTHMLGFPDRRLVDQKGEAVFLSSTSVESFAHLHELREEIDALARNARVGRLSSSIRVLDFDKK